MECGKKAYNKSVVGLPASGKNSQGQYGPENRVRVQWVQRYSQVERVKKREGKAPPTPRPRLRMLKEVKWRKRRKLGIK